VDVARTGKQRNAIIMSTNEVDVTFSRYCLTEAESEKK